MQWYGILWTDVARVLGVLMSICFVLYLIFCPRLVVMPFRSLGLAIGGLLKAILDTISPQDEDEKESDRISRHLENLPPGNPVYGGGGSSKEYKSEFGKKYGNRG